MLLYTAINHYAKKKKKKHLFLLASCFFINQMHNYTKEEQKSASRSEEGQRLSASPSPEVKEGCFQGFETCPTRILLRMRPDK